MTRRQSLTFGTDPERKPLEIEAGDEVLRMFSVSARIEMAADVTVGGLHLETFLPADDRTRAVFAAS